MADNSVEIERIEAILNSGATSAVVDGNTITVDHETLSKRLRRLKATDDSARGRRPTVLNVRMGGV